MKYLMVLEQPHSKNVGSLFSDVWQKYQVNELSNTQDHAKSFIDSKWSLKRPFEREENDFFLKIEVSRIDLLLFGEAFLLQSCKLPAQLSVFARRQMSQLPDSRPKAFPLPPGLGQRPTIWSEATAQSTGPRKASLIRVTCPHFFLSSPLSRQWPEQQFFFKAS